MSNERGIAGQATVKNQVIGVEGSTVGTVFAGARVDENVPLAPLTTLRVGPVAARVITCTSTDQVVASLRHLDASGSEPPLVLAGGSNVVISDALTDLTVIRLANNNIRVDGNVLHAEAAAAWDDVVVAAVESGLGGLECLSGIPGSTGATPVQNVGAYGVEVADAITRVRLLDRRSGEVRWAAADELGFGYRTSVLKHSDAATVLEVEFALDESGRSAPLRYGELVDALGAAAGERDDPAVVRAAVLALRAGKGMVLDEADHDTWSVGSFFTNPVVPQSVYRELAERCDHAVPNYPAPDGVKLAAGWLVERAGFGKGYPDADGARCRLSTKHALALTNRGGASTEDVLALARTVRDGVWDVFGVTLIPEPVLVGCSL
jgi:UDP-N-acetylmuramate dehydrogenase